jgi:hypothetical protein
MTSFLFMEKLLGSFSDQIKLKFFALNEGDPVDPETHRAYNPHRCRSYEGDTL